MKSPETTTSGKPESLPWLCRKHHETWGEVLESPLFIIERYLKWKNNFFGFLET